MLTQTLLPLTFAILFAVLATLGAEQVEDVTTIRAKTVGQGKAQLQVVFVRLGDAGTATEQVVTNGLGITGSVLLIIFLR